MAAATESVQSVFDQMFENLRKAVESQMEMQQELLRQWSTGCPGFPQPQTAWLERVQKFQKSWGKTVKELLDKHREVLNEQYGLAVDSLQEAFRVAQSSDPEEFAKRCEGLCRKSLDVMREAGELQAKHLQEAVSKWTEVAAKSGS